MYLKHEDVFILSSILRVIYMPSEGNVGNVGRKFRNAIELPPTYLVKKYLLNNSWGQYIRQTITADSCPLPPCPHSHLL